MSDQPVIHIDDVPLDDFGDGDKHIARIGKAGDAIGMEQLGCTVTVVPAGKCAFPFHNHHMIEEAIYVLEGEGEYRFGDARFPVAAGSLMAAPTGGRDRAHQLVNTGDVALRYLCFSTQSAADIVEYPDSDKILSVRFEPGTQQPSFRHIGRTADNADYWEGE